MVTGGHYHRVKKPPESQACQTIAIAPPPLDETA